jgi:hypothetical protein
MWAAQLGRARIVAHLVQRYGCSVHVEQTDQGEGVGVTALHLAAYHGHADVVRILLRAGADKKKAIKEGFKGYSDRYAMEGAKSGKKIYERNPSELFPPLYVGHTNVPSSKFWPHLHAAKVKVDLSKGMKWAQFDEIIGLLEAPASESGGHRAVDLGANYKHADLKESYFRPKTSQKRGLAGGCVAGAGIQHRRAAEGGGAPFTAAGFKAKTAAARQGAAKTNANPFSVLEAVVDSDEDNDGE